MVPESSGLPGPSNKRGPSQPMEEGRMIDTLQEYRVCPFALGNGAQCLKITSQVWLAIVNTARDYHNQFSVLQVSAFKRQEIRLMVPVPEVYCSVRCGLSARDLIGCVDNSLRVRSLEC